MNKFLDWVWRQTKMLTVLYLVIMALGTTVFMGCCMVYLTFAASEWNADRICAICILPFAVLFLAFFAISYAQDLYCILRYWKVPDQPKQGNSCSEYPMGA